MSAGLSSLVAKGPKDLAAKLDKETCAGAIAALNAAAATLGADGKPVDKLEAWQYLTVVDGDFGFANGDQGGLPRRCCVAVQTPFAAHYRCFL